MESLGRHHLIELWQADNLDRVDIGEEALIEVVKATGGTLLETRFVPFPNGGYSGVCLIAESHVTIHTWPEHEYAAVDMFTCGVRMDMERGLEVLKKYFAPRSMQVSEVKRGVIV